MGRFLAMLLCLCQLVLPVQAKEVKYVALTLCTSREIPLRAWWPPE